MPHAELKYSGDLPIDPAAILAQIEQVILTHDSAAGACKGRAFPAAVFHHSHLLVSVALLAKPHRDAAFSAALIADLEAAVKGLIPVPCAFSLVLSYSDAFYVTNAHMGQPAR